MRRLVLSLVHLMGDDGGLRVRSQLRPSLWNGRPFCPNMEAEKLDQDFDELDKLLGEIPTATIRNPYTRKHIQNGAALDFELISVNEVEKTSTPGDLYGMSCTTLAVKDCEIISADDTLSSSKTTFDQEDGPRSYHGTSTTITDQNTTNLPDEQSLASAFEDLGFMDKIAAVSTTPYFKCYPSSSNHALLPDGHCSENLENSSGLESAEMSILPLSIRQNGVCVPNPASEGCSPFVTKDAPSILNGMVDGHDDARLLKLNFHDPRNQMSKSVFGECGEQRQSFPVCSASMPVNQGIHAYLLPGLSAQGFEFPPPSFQQQYYMDPPPHDYIHHHQQRQQQQLSQSSALWGDMQYERNCRDNLRYLYSQQLENQHFEGQKRRISAIGPLSGNTIQPYLHMSIPHQAGQVNQYSYGNNSATNRRYNQLDPSLLRSNLGRCHHNGLSGQFKSCSFPQGQDIASSYDLYSPIKSAHGPQISERFSKQTFPEKILTRSHGVDLLQTLKSGAPGNNQLPEHADITRRVFSNDNAHSHVVHGVQSLDLDAPSNQGSSPDNLSESHDVKSSGLKYDSLNNAIGKIHVLAKDQNGCRFLQQIFNEGNHEDVDILFLEIIDHVVEIMMDPFGNYLVQKLVEVCREEQITHIIHEISQGADKLLKISCNQHGTRVVQKILETVKSPVQFSMIVSALKPVIVLLIKNNNGSHVAQRCLDCLSPENKECLFEDAVANCIELARDRQGCCVLQKCLSALDGDQKFRLISNLTCKARDLSQDPYGNYVVQYILDQKVPWATIKILDQLEGHYRTLSVQKYSSNVVEKCLKYAGDARRVNIIRELIDGPHFVQISLDPYGNYVIQSAHRECKGALQAAFREAIRPHVTALRTNHYGKKVLSTCYGK
ncbi:uncharacterized protein LOC135631802 isoform X1 [Musa acuminata AAA Group]|uniref:uncharacterized protein LOC135631802 isoform X1 n=2 Tax=Musa acuminata AAA Group TaxID=214697 RepID=UPI0031D61D72